MVIPPEICVCGGNWKYANGRAGACPRRNCGVTFGGGKPPPYMYALNGLFWRKIKKFVKPIERRRKKVYNSN